MSGLRGHRSALVALLVVSAALRVALVVRGGQRFFPDENRYLRSLILLRHLERGDLVPALDYVLETPDHVGFLAVGLVPAVAQRAAIRGLGLPDVKASIDETIWLPALLLSTISVASVGLVFALARRVGSPPGEALLAVFLMASSTAMLCYSRHLLPYDSAMALALLAAWLGLGARDSTGRSLAVGTLAGAAFMAYHGYWLLALVVLLLRSAGTGVAGHGALRHGFAALLGLGLIPVTLTALTAVRGQELFVAQMARFSHGAATQADFAEGWSLPWEYLWHAERGLLLVLVGGCGLLLWHAVRHPTQERRVLLWLVCVAGIYSAGVILANGLERVGAFGRQSRQLVPFLCLAAAGGLWRTSAGLRLRRPLLACLSLALAAQAAWNFATPLTQLFPREIARELTVRYGPLSRENTVVVEASPEDVVVPGARYVLLNARYLYPVSGLQRPRPGRVLFRTSHPQSYLPYQYEGLLPAERGLLRSTDVSIRLLDTAP